MANCFSSSDLQEEDDEARKICHHQAAAVLNNMDVDMDMPFLAPQLTATTTTPDEASSFNFNGYPFSLHPWSIPSEGFTEDRAASASTSHSEAEKRRRDRINAQLATLRKLIPKSEKMDKAALLGSVVEHVREMKNKALMEMRKYIMIPTDVDEVTIDYADDHEYWSSTSKEKILLKASVCCDDRPELFSELNRALKNLRLTIVDANMISLGGRIKSTFILCANSSIEGGICMNTLKQSLKVALSRIASSCSTTGSNNRIKSRRQRFFLPSREFN